MNHFHLRVVHSGDGSAGVDVHSAAMPQSASGRVRRILCVPMADLHGQTFLRILAACRPALVVDARRYPYFDLVALGRRNAFRAIDQMAARYVHAHIDLRPPVDQRARWRLRADAEETFSELGRGPGSDLGPFVVLLDRSAQVSVLDEALRNSKPVIDGSWQVESSDAVLSAAR